MFILGLFSGVTIQKLFSVNVKKSVFFTWKHFLPEKISFSLEMGNNIDNFTQEFIKSNLDFFDNEISQIA